MDTREQYCLISGNIDRLVIMPGFQFIFTLKTSFVFFYSSKQNSN